MGLDMYLTRNFFIYQPLDDEPPVVEVKGIPVNPGKVQTVTERVGYWRKENQIHAWFVENVQKGTDDCGEYDVSLEQLMELRGLCAKTIAYVESRPAKTIQVETGWEVGSNGEKKVINYEDVVVYEVDEEEMKALLPTRSGFFFGSTEYDETYLEGCRETIRIIDNILEEEKKIAAQAGKQVRKTARGKMFPKWSHHYSYRSSW